MTVQKKFRDAVYAILECPITSQLGVLWREYRDNLRDIDPMEIPEKLRPKFLQMKAILEKRMEENVDTSLYFAQYGKKAPYDPEVREAERQKIIAGRGRQRALHNFGGPPASAVRTILFELAEKLPKKAKKQ